MVPPALTSGCRVGAAAIERGWLGSPAVGIWVRPSPGRVGAVTACGGPPALMRTTEVLSRTTQTSERVVGTDGEGRRALLSTGASSPAYGPANNVEPAASGRIPTRKDSSPLAASMEA